MESIVTVVSGVEWDDSFSNSKASNWESHMTRNMCKSGNYSSRFACVCVCMCVCYGFICSSVDHCHASVVLIVSAQ